MESVFLDSAYAIALSVEDDRHHVAALKLSDTMEIEMTRVITTRAVIFEIGNALAKRRYRPGAVQLLAAFESDKNIEIVEVDIHLYQEAFSLFRSRPDKEWGLIDCISCVIMKQRRLTDVLTSDDHFRQMGFNVLLGPEGPGPGFA